MQRPPLHQSPRKNRLNMSTTTFLQRFLLLSLSLAVLSLAGCANQGASQALFGPYNTKSIDGSDEKLMLDGFDPVAYHLIGKHTRGVATISAQFDGVTYRFENENNKATFLKEPQRYAPQYGGFCANGIVYGIPWGGDGDTWKIIDGKLYIFGGQSSKNYFLMNEAANLKLADEYWSNDVKGSNALIQRYKRLVLRVPHYQSGAALEAQWQAWQQSQKSAK
jgi:YHS domain-containing protein